MHHGLLILCPLFHPFLSLSSQLGVLVILQRSYRRSFLYASFRHSYLSPPWRMMASRCCWCGRARAGPTRCCRRWRAGPWRWPQPCARHRTRSRGSRSGECFIYMQGCSVRIYQSWTNYFTTKKSLSWTDAKTLKDSALIPFKFRNVEFRILLMFCYFNNNV